MAAAGIDVALPVFWGDTGSMSVWSVPGLLAIIKRRSVPDILPELALGELPKL